MGQNGGSERPEIEITLAAGSGGFTLDTPGGKAMPTATLRLYAA
jgi:hypothetical protein